MRKLFLLLSLPLVIWGCNSKPKAVTPTKNPASIIHKEDGKTELEEIKKAGSSFYDWYFKNKFTYIDIIKDKNGKCLLDTASYFTKLRKLNTVSEKFISREKERLSGCGTFISTVDYADYEAADAYEYDEYCLDLYYMYWINSQEEPNSFAAANVKKLDDQHANIDITLKYGDAAEPLSNVKLEKEGNSWKITAITFKKQKQAATKVTDMFGKWSNSLVSMEISNSSLILFYHGQCAYNYPIRKLTGTSFEMIWSRDMDCKFDNGTANTFELTEVPEIGKPFAKFSYQNNILYAEYYYKDWVKKYGEKINKDVFTSKYFRTTTDH